MRLAKSFPVCVLAVFLAACGQSGGGAQDDKAKFKGKGKGGGPVPVLTAAAALKSVPIEIQVVGNVEAYSTVSIRAQVSGQLTDVMLKDGDFVHKGDVLFKIDPRVIDVLEAGGFIPVVAPIGVGEDGESFNINADLVAGAIAGALRAEKLLMMTDIKGIRDANGRHLSTVSRKDVQRMMKKGVITEGMIPKVHACLDALGEGVGKAHIIDGRIPHAILLEVFTRKGIGTEIVN